MMTLTKITVVAALVCGLSACSASVEQSEKIAETAHTETAHSDAHASHAVIDKSAPYATVKPGAAVTLNSALPKAMTSGSYQTVQLQLQDGHQDGIMSVRLEPSAGLRLFGASSSKTFNMAAAGPHIWDVDVKADTDGVYFLNVFAEAQGRPRSFSVRLDMGVVTQKMIDEALPKQGELVDGGKIRVLEATETIR